MLKFNPDRYGSVVARLMSENRLNELGPGAQNQSAYELLEAIQPTDLHPHENVPPMTWTHSKTRPCGCFHVRTHTQNWSTLTIQCAAAAH